MLQSDRIHEISPTIQPINKQDLLSLSTWDEISMGENYLTVADPSELNEAQVCLTAILEDAIHM